MRIARTAQQVDKVVIVDNGSSEDCLKMLHDICAGQGVHLVSNQRNVGIARALNQGIEYARTAGHQWVLTMDEDSIPTDTMVNDLISAYSSLPDRQRVGLIGAKPIDSTTGNNPYEDQCRGKICVEKEVLITSGTLMSLAAWEDIGSLREEFFIDRVDQEYCLRLRRRGYKVFLACRAELHHSLGNPQVYKLLWRKVVPTQHSYVRRYFMARNTLLMAREYFISDPRWITRQVIGLIKATILIALCEGDKGRKLKSTVVGVWHGLIGKTGQHFSDELLNSYRTPARVALVG